MNAMGSNSSLLNLFLSLGQTADGSTSLLGSDTEGDGLFSSLMADLGLSDESAEALLETEGVEDQSLTLIESLPLADQTLPPEGAGLPQLAEVNDEETDTALLPSETEEADIATLFAQISQGQQPIPVRDVEVQQNPRPDAGMADTDTDTDAEELSLATEAGDLVETDDNSSEDVTDETAAAAALLAMQNNQAAPVVVQSQVSPDRGRLQVSSDSRSTQLNEQDSAATEETSVADTEMENSDEIDFYMPETDKPVKHTQVAGQSATSANTQGGDMVAAADDSQLTQSSEDTVIETDVGDEFTDSDAENTLEEFARTERGETRDKMKFGEDTREWGGALGTRIITMVAEGVQEARIQLDPPELGSMEIKLQVSQEQASVQVQVQNTQVREVLESNAHRLRESLAQQGMTLNEFDVSSQDSSGQQNGDGSADQSDSQQYASGYENGDDGVTEELTDAATVVSSSDSLLDTFA